MNKKASKLLLVVLVVALLAVSLTACGLFKDSTKITKVGIEQSTTWKDADSDGIFEVELGKVITLNATWDNSNTVKSPSIQWYIQEDEHEKAAISPNGTEKQLTYEINRRSDIVYTISVVVNEIESTTPFKFVIVNADLDAPSFECSTSGLYVTQNVIQQNILMGLKDVGLVVKSNFENTDGSEITIKWYEDDSETKSEVYDAAVPNTYTYLFDVSSISTAQTVKIKCEFIYQFNGVEKSKNTVIDLEFVEKFEAVDKVSLSSTNTKLTGTYSTYHVEGTISDAKTIQISASVLPAATDLSTDCIWTKVDKNGTTVLSPKTRTINAALTYGKNTFTATIDNVESKQIIVYFLSATDFNANKSCILDVFVWDGNDQDHYINNQHDLNMLAGYLVSCHDVSKKDDMFLARAEWKDGSKTTDEFSDALQIAMTTGVDESGSFSFSYTTTTLGLNPASKLGEPTEQCPSSYNVEQKNVLVRYETNTSVRTNLPVDGFAQTMKVSNSNQLYRAVSWGYKPIIDDSNLNSLYQKAKTVLLTYVNDSMTDLEKVRVIYDWIVNNVDYDQAALVSTDSNKTSYNAFYLEGVFNDKCAVCDGKSKAFTLLCGMEGIKAERIMGYADKNLGAKKAQWLAGSFTSEELGIEGISSGVPATEFQLSKLMSAYGWGHAWNKVFLDADGDDVKEWYVVDATWGDISSVDSLNPKNITEFLSYDYFLVTDADVEGNHFSIQEQNVANTDYDVYSETIEIDEEDVCIYVETAAQLLKIKNFCNANKGLYIIVKVKSGISLSDFAYVKFTNSVDVYYICISA